MPEISADLALWMATGWPRPWFSFREVTAPSQGLAMVSKGPVVTLGRGSLGPSSPAAPRELGEGAQPSAGLGRKHFS